MTILRNLTLKRVTRILLWLFITLVTLIVLLYVWTNWSGKRRWAATLARIEREGETLDFRKLLPETPPEEANLLAIEPLRGIAAVIEEDANKGEPGAKRQALETMKWSTQNKAPASNGVSLGQATATADWVRFVRESKFIDLPADAPSTSRDLLNALDAKFPLLKQLTEQVPQRSQAMFTPGMREREIPEMLFSLQVPHYTVAQTLARTLTLRARAGVDAKDSQEATRSILVLKRVSSACESEPLLIGFLVGITINAMATEAVWHCLHERALTDADLHLLQKSFMADDIEKSLLLAMRGEMAVGLGSLAFLQEAVAGRKKISQEMIAALSGVTALSVKSYRALPSGLFDHWKSVMADMELRFLIQPLKNGGIAAVVRAEEAMNREFMEKRNFVLHADHIMPRMIVPAMTHISSNALLAQVRARQAVAAIALERFYLKNAKYPARLDALVPEFLASLPLDPCDGKHMRFRLSETGRYLLWSVAFDGKDDEGKVNKNSLPMRSPDYLGDWTWQYEPVK
jgi:hypothetical protein